MSHYLQVIVDNEECGFDESSLAKLMIVLADLAKRYFNESLKKPVDLERYNPVTFRYAEVVSHYLCYFLKMSQYADEEQRGLIVLVSFNADSPFFSELGEIVCITHNVLGTSAVAIEKVFGDYCNIPANTIIQTWSVLPNKTWMTNVDNILAEVLKPTLVVNNTGDNKRIM